MALYIQTNVASLNAQSNLSKTQSALQTSFARLSSGYRINSSADDAAGLGISDSMTAQIRSYGVAERNSNDGISMAQTADGASAQITGMLTRMRELSVQAANGSLQSGDRTNINTEFTQLQSEIDRVSSSTSFNGSNLLDGKAGTAADGKVTFQVGIGTTAGVDTVDVNFKALDSKTLAVDTGTIDVTDASKATASITAIDAALKTVSTQRATFGAAVNRLQTTVANIQSMKTNLSAANSRIRDVDVAEETASMARQQVLSQAGAAVLAQANQAPQLALGLLRG
jgi:flagellin